MTEKITLPNTALAKRVYDRCFLTGEFKLRSGRIAQHYFDKYMFETDPVLLSDIAAGLEALVPAGIDLLAGLEMGGIPVVTALSARTGIPAVFVRKKAKEYGTAKLAEGPSVAGKRLLIVEDVVTSGGQIELSAADLRACGGIIVASLCVVDRCEGGAEKLADAGIELQSLLRGPDIEAAGRPGGPS